MGINEGTCDEHRVMYTIVKSLYCMPEINIAPYVIYPRIQLETVFAFLQALCSRIQAVTGKTVQNKTVHSSYCVALHSVYELSGRGGRSLQPSPPPRGVSALDCSCPVPQIPRHAQLCLMPTAESLPSFPGGSSGPSKLVFDGQCHQTFIEVSEYPFAQVMLGPTLPF